MSFQKKYQLYRMDFREQYLGLRLESILSFDAGEDGISM
jgi:hypothetical protein